MSNAASLPNLPWSEDVEDDDAEDDGQEWAPVGRYGVRQLSNPARLPYAPESDQQWWRLRSVWIKVGIGLVIVIFLAAWLNTRADLQTTQHNLATTTAQLASANAEVSHLKKLQADLQSQLKTSQATLGKTKTNLLGQLSTQKSNAALLKTCLSGVTSALVKASNNDLSGAQSALNGVSGPCGQVQKLLN